MAKLITTPRRVALAALAGIAVPTVLVALILILTSDSAAKGALAMFGLSVGVLIFPGAPLWALCHWRRASILAAGLVGAIAGVLMTLPVISELARDEAPSLGQAISATLFLLGGGGVSGFACALMWRIAYPKTLQRPSVAEVF